MHRCYVCAQSFSRQSERAQPSSWGHYPPRFSHYQTINSTCMPLTEDDLEKKSHTLDWAATDYIYTDAWARIYTPTFLKWNSTWCLTCQCNKTCCASSMENTLAFHTESPWFIRVLLRVVLFWGHGKWYFVSWLCTVGYGLHLMMQRTAILNQSKEPQFHTHRAKLCD